MVAGLELQEVCAHRVCEGNGKKAHRLWNIQVPVPAAHAYLKLGVYKMKHIYLNLKRLDVPPELGGVNRLAPPLKWAKTIVTQTEKGLAKYDPNEVEFVQFFPEAHLIPALDARQGNVRIGSQGVYREDTQVGANYGAFTTNRPAHSVSMLGCTDTIIGQNEERMDKAGVLAEAGTTDAAAINRILNHEILCAQAAGLRVLYCVGETSEERSRWEHVIEKQLEEGLESVNKDDLVIAYEPMWTLEPATPPVEKAHIEQVAKFIREKTGGLDVVFGAGLRADNVDMIASIQEISGGVISVTHFFQEVEFRPDEYLEIVAKYLQK